MNPFSVDCLHMTVHRCQRVSREGPLEWTPSSYAATLSLLSPCSPSVSPPSVGASPPSSPLFYSTLTHLPVFSSPPCLVFPWTYVVFFFSLLGQPALDNCLRHAQLEQCLIAKEKGYRLVLKGDLVPYSQQVTPSRPLSCIGAVVLFV